MTQREIDLGVCPVTVTDNKTLEQAAQWAQGEAVAAVTTQRNDDFGIEILRALGLDYQDGFRWLTLHIRAGEPPSVVTEQFTRDMETNRFVEVNGKLASVMRRYKLVLQEEKNL